jgi:hypothetical protein
VGQSGGVDNHEVGQSRGGTIRRWDNQEVGQLGGGTVKGWDGEGVGR